MQRPESSKQSPHAQPRVPNEAAIDYYEGVELAPLTLESLVTWDVSVHAQREKDRLSPAPSAARVEGGY